jgi:hypothetical protein
MAPPTLLSGPATSNGALPSLSGSRSRPQARKKVNDDAAYFAAAGIKRNAGDRADGEPRVKRKRVEASGPGAVSSFGGRKLEKERAMHDGEVRKPVVSAPRIQWKVSDTRICPNILPLNQVEFSNMSASILHRYLMQFDLIPGVYPSPLKADDPPSPTSLEHSGRQISRASTPSTVTPANRPRREGREQGKRRSSRLLDEEGSTRIPILADVADVHAALAGIADRHFRTHTVREVDTLATFMSRISGEKHRQM